MAQQPNWKSIGTVGDVNPLDYDGGYVYEDTTGVYPAELEYVRNVSGTEDENGPWEVYRWPLDRYEMVDAGGDTLLVPFGFGSRSDLPHPLANYDAWFNDDISQVASYVGSNVAEMRASLCSDNPMERAWVYLDLATCHGFENFDSYPLDYSDREELEKRYATL